MVLIRLAQDPSSQPMESKDFLGSIEQSPTGEGRRAAAGAHGSGSRRGEFQQLAHNFYTLPLHRYIPGGFRLTIIVYSAPTYYMHIVV